MKIIYREHDFIVYYDGDKYYLSMPNKEPVIISEEYAISLMLDE